MEIVIFCFCFSLSLFCPCPFSLDCLQIFLVIVLDLMTRPRRRPFFLYSIVNAFCFPREGRLHQIPSPYPLLCDVDVDGLRSRVVLLLGNTFSASSSLPLKFVRFRDRRHRPMAADDVRKFSFWWRSRWFGGGNGCVWVAESVLMCLVVVLVVVAAVAAVGAVVPGPWEYIP
jgi:hypothetical protein